MITKKYITESKGYKVKVQANGGQQKAGYDKKKSRREMQDL